MKALEPNLGVEMNLFPFSNFTENNSWKRKRGSPLWLLGDVWSVTSILMHIFLFGNTLMDMLVVWDQNSEWAFAIALQRVYMMKTHTNWISQMKTQLRAFNSANLVGNFVTFCTRTIGRCQRARMAACRAAFFRTNYVVYFSDFSFYKT